MHVVLIFSISNLSKGFIQHTTTAKSFICSLLTLVCHNPLSQFGIKTAGYIKL